MIERLWAEQKGVVMPLALVVLGVGVMTVTPFLNGMSTTLFASRNSQISTHEQYAADGAYEHAVWSLNHGSLAGALPNPCDSTSYMMGTTLNGIQPSVTVTRTGDCAGSGGSGGLTFQISITSGDSLVTRETTLLFLSCDGLSPTITGTNGDDTLTGTNRDDVIIGLGGNDNIRGRGGEDVICGGEGDDTIDGGSRSDRIFGGDGDDRISGRSGRDLINGEAGDDVLDGDSGRDTLDGGPGFDDCDGGSGNDTFINCELQRR